MIYRALDRLLVARLIQSHGRITLGTRLLDALHSLMGLLPWNRPKHALTYRQINPHASRAWGVRQARKRRYV